jgi:pyruvate,water dikinase
MADQRRAPLLITLADAATLGASELGTKAANLARLASSGFPVPRGFVVTPAAEANWDAACARIRAAAAALGGQRFAVRSSGTAEDLDGASFAGQYETHLHVSLDALPETVRAVFASAAMARVAAYRQARAGASSVPPRMAVLVQEMVAADAAGVAFSANPLTGARDEVVITAVRGLGERLVAGEAVGDEWVVRDHTAVCRRRREGVLAPAQAVCIAALARRTAVHFGVPQDMEWAIAGGRLIVLQARPMTALPEAVAWTPPTNGWWLRNLRLGEWLPEAVTPLCADWLIPRIDAGFARAARADLGFTVVPNTAFVNGWYYTTPQGRGSLPAMVLRLLVHPRALVHLYRLLFQVTRHPERAAGVLAHAHAAWRDRLLP